MLQKLATSLLVLGLSSSAYGAAHLTTHPGTWTIDPAAASGTATSLNDLKVNAAKHEPHLAIDAAGIMTISVLGTDGAGYHPQGAGHWIDTVFVMDGDNKIICEHEFPEPAVPGASGSGSASASDSATPTFTCPTAVTTGTATAYEHCNLHGLWVGSTLKVEWEIAAAVAAAKADNKANVATGAIKHEPLIRAVECDASTGCFEVIVLGTDGDQENLHPQAPPTHFIDAVFVKDGHNAVVWYSNDATGIKQDVAKSVVITNDFAAEGGILTPYEHCNLHGLWVGTSFTVQAAKTVPASASVLAVGGAALLVAAAALLM